MAISTRLVTQAEYGELPEPRGGRYELRHGEVVFVAYPKSPHTLAQDNLLDELKLRARGKGRVIMEMPYCPLPEYEVWGADVAFVSKVQWSSWDKRNWLPGSPLL